MPRILSTSLASLGIPSEHWFVLFEYLVKWNQIHQHFLTDKVVPVNGYVTVPDRPGMSMELDPAVIDEERYLKVEVL